jgi:hypothetical protein
MVILRILVFLAGLGLVIWTLRSAVQTFVLPRSIQDSLSTTVFTVVQRFFRLMLWIRRAWSYEQRDRVMAFHAPVSLLILPAVWLVCVLVGFMCMYRALGVSGWWSAFQLSGSSLLTLGFSSVNLPFTAILEFSEAAIGLMLVALLIAYLPTMYSAFSRREAAVAMLEVRAGSPPSAYEMLARFHRLQRLDKLTEVWADWEIWFAEIEENHTSLAALTFFRSPQPERSWVTAAGAVLDTASLVAAALDQKRDFQAEICIRAGYLALRQIADFFGIVHNPNPGPTDTISVSRDEFTEVYDRLAEQGVPLKPDREQAWRDFVGWRVNYDTVLLALAALTMAPYAPWSSDRSRINQHKPKQGLFARKKRHGRS